MDKVVTYAQNREDIILSGFFDMSQPGFYVDVGANDPTHESVTKYFYDKGWRGINIEPIKTHFKQLQRQRPRDINLNIGVAAKAGTLELREYKKGSGLSTFSKAAKKAYSATEGTYSVFTDQYIDYEVPVVTLAEVFSEQRVTDIHFLKVDVEGLEYEVLSGNDWQQFRPAVICIEAEHVDQDWRPLLAKSGYKKVFYDGLNEYYIDPKSKLLKSFSYVDAVIFQEPIVNFRLLEDYKKYDEVVAWLEDTNRGLEKQLQAANQQVHDLQKLINEVTPLKKHLKRQVKQRLLKLDKKVTDKLAGDSKYVPHQVSQVKGNKQELLQHARDIDVQNFNRFNDRPTKVALRGYEKLKVGTIKTVRSATKLRRGSKK